jgi:type IV pilus assembly protein PilY1
MPTPTSRIRYSRTLRRLAAGLFACVLAAVSQASTSTTITISETPLTAPIAAHPQVLFAIGNSESTDGTVSGAIMTGAGGLSSSLASALAGSSSPSCYLIPAGFTPPVSGYGSGTGGCASGYAPNTVTISSVEYDNSPSRLNVAKGGITSILQTYMSVADFGLEQYTLSSVTAYTTWVYYMSDSNGFEFVNNGSTTTPPTPLTGDEVVANPCYNYKSLSTSSTVYSNCNSLSTNLYSSANISAAQWMDVANSSDDPSINDVLYANISGVVCVTYGSVSPSNPYTGYTLSQYESGSVYETYPNDMPSGSCARETGPTNAGFVPYSPQVMYVERGFGYISSSSATSGTVSVAVQTATPNAPSNQSPTTTSVNTALSAFGISLSSNYATSGTPLAPETNSNSTGEIKAGAEQSPLAGLLTGAYNYFTGSSKPASNNGCTAQKYVVLITDGLPTLDTSSKNWPPLGSAAATGYGVTTTLSSTTPTTVTSTNSTAYNNTITELQTLAAAGIKTYVIGLGAGVDPANNPSAAAALTSMAIAGGTTNYFPASSPQALDNDLQVILSQIIGTAQSTSSTAVNSTGLNTSTYVYQASFSDSDTYQDWTGDVRAYLVSQSTEQVSTAYAWSSQAQLDLNSQAQSAPTGYSGHSAPPRVIATWQPGTNSAIPFEWIACSSSSSSSGSSGSSSCPTTPSTSGIVQASTLGTALTSTSIVPVASDSGLGTTAVIGQDRLNYLRGDTTLEVRNGSSSVAGVYRNRSHLLGDIVDSNPTFVGAPSSFFASTSYQTFQQTYASRTPVIYVGGNDGMFHAFNATTPTNSSSSSGGSSSSSSSSSSSGCASSSSSSSSGSYTAASSSGGAELFSFIPNAVFNNLPKLTSPYYNSQHQFYVDGSPTAADVQFANASWHTIVTSGENGGGNSVFAIDVTNPTAITSESTLASDVLWEFTDSDMGYSYSTPAVALTNDTTSSGNPQFMVFFGNGYDSPNNKPVLYALSPDAPTAGTAKTYIAKIDLCAQITSACTNTTLPNGLSSVTAVNSSGALSAPADTVYAGDLQGNLWRINISNANPANWTVSVLYQAVDASGNRQPITVTPSVSLNPQYPQRLGVMVFFGTGQLLSTNDLSSTNTQTIYGIYDSRSGPGDTSGAISGFARPPSSTTTCSTSCNYLVQQTLSTTTTDGETVLTSTNNAVNLNLNPGWFSDLSFTSGMRNVTNPTLEPGGGLLITTYAPSSSQCACGGASDLLILNYATGGPFPQPEFVLPGESLSASTTCTTGAATCNPVGMYIGGEFVNTVSVITTANNGGTNALKILSTGPGSFMTIADRGATKSRTAWWELQ